MKSVLIIVFLNFSGILFGQGYLLEHTVTHSQANCNKSRITTDTVVLWSKHKTVYFAYRKLYFYSKNGFLDSLTTDSLGHFSIRLKSGKYRVFLPYKHFKKLPFGKFEEFDMNCLEKEWQKPDMIVYVSWRGFRVIDMGLGKEYCPWHYPCSLNKSNKGKEF